MMRIPNVTIITVTYQAEHVIRNTIESVLNQHVLNQETPGIEYILIDGGSTDGTVEQIKQYEELFKARFIPLRWISEPDKGLYDAMNKGLKMASGDYVWFLNAGDTLVDNDTLTSLWDSLISSRTSNQEKTDETELPDFIYGETMIVDEKGHIKGARRLKAPATLTWKSFRMGMLVCHQSMLVKRSLAPVFNLNYHYSADFDWAIRCLHNSKSTHNTNMVLCHFLEGGLTKKKMQSSLKERFQIMVKQYGWFSTVLLHGWFIIRAGWFRLRHGWI